MKALYLLLVLFSNIEAGGNGHRRGNSLQPFMPAAVTKTRALVKGCLVHQEFTDKFASKLNGETLQKKFTNGKLLGKGSFGEVKEISWGSERVAVKRMEIPKHSSEIQAQAREIEFIEKTKEFNGSMEFLGCLETSANLYYVTEKLYKDFIDPEVLITHKQKDALTRLKLYSQIVNKFKKLHALDITHQDIKPANLMVKDKAASDFRIIDFGMGSMVGEYLMGGTPLYNSPEKIANGYLAKPYYDVYALALTIAVIESNSNSIFKGVSASCVKTTMSRFCYENIMSNIQTAFNKVGMDKFFPVIKDALTESKKMTMADFESRINDLIGAKKVQNVATIDEDDLQELTESKRNAEQYENDPVKAREAALGYLRNDILFQKNPKLYDKAYRPKKSEEKKSEEKKSPEAAPLRKKISVISDPKKRNVAPEKNLKKAATRDDYDAYVDEHRRKRDEEENARKQELKRLQDSNIRLKKQIQQAKEQLALEQLEREQQAKEQQAKEQLARENIARGRDMRDNNGGRRESYDPRRNNNALLKKSYNNYPRNNIYKPTYIQNWLNDNPRAYGENNAGIYGGNRHGTNIYGVNRIGAYKNDEIINYPRYPRRII